MAFLRGSTNYVWCTTSVLGKGATGAVYQGVNKINGEPVAVKTFNQLSHMRPQDVQMREFEVLEKVKHENIVKLLAIEEEQQESRGKVIVMELCTGGSLFNILDDPENTYGLEEKEFLLVLSHLSAGMKHLRDNNLVHRDLKPGNIMKFICDDGTTVYKLTDFGAARELHEGQQFASLYGTEEYLHPDMYERAVLRKPVGKTFGATVDLWSIGVTLYHVATGNLPFRPYGGRRNKEMMYRITTTKASGIISGIQTKDNGPIEWNSELPINCQLSAGLKKIVTPLLAGLLEADPKKVWKFDRFFNEVMNVLSCKVVNIFDVKHVSKIKVYIRPEEKYDELENYIKEQTDISASDQILLNKENLFWKVIGRDTPALGYPTLPEDDPLVLFHKGNNNVTIIPYTDLPPFSDFPNLVSVENDAAQAKVACSISHVCKRRIENISLNCTLIHKASDYFTRYINNELKRINVKCVYLDEITMVGQQTADSFKLAQSLSNCLLGSTDQLNYSDYVDEFEKLCKAYVSESSAKVQQLHKTIVDENQLRLEWESASKKIKNPAETRAPARARTSVERQRDSWQHLVRDRATRSLSYNDEQFHVLERIKIMETNRTIKSLLESECRKD
ncbi:TANK binding kinase 1 ubiquitin-like domain [Popillia japonica]|uniref:TANK binding kinase 1 ubiquitin-like domain n=1 Tax=Popillia japonica TaxID=7064 RepID=A0AAW1IZ89_POPJA